MGFPVVVRERERDCCALVELNCYLRDSLEARREEFNRMQIEQAERPKRIDWIAIGAE